MNRSSSPKRITTILRASIIIALVMALFLLQSSTILAGSTPSISIVEVVPNAMVTIALYNFPANGTYDVQMGVRGSGGYGGYFTASFKTGAETYSVKTVEIPTPLYDEALIDILITGEGIAVSGVFYNTGTYVPPVPVPGGYSGIPTTSIKSVVPGESVTVTTYNFPKEKDFIALMGKFGTRGIGGYEVGSFYSAGGGSFELTFEIPDELADEELIAIRLQTADNYYYAFDWFYNKPGINAGYVGYPTTTILSSVAKTEVEVKVFNLPKEVDFDVTIGAFGTRGVGGTKVAEFNSGDGGTQTFTFTVLDAYKENYKLSIRLDSGIWYAFDWWVNNPDAVPAGGVVVPDVNAGYVGYPTTTILSSVAKTEVEVKVFNLPKEVDFDVTISEFGKRGLSGQKVAEFNSGDGGTQTFTFTVPDAYKENHKLSIRLDSGIWYAFDWWVNNPDVEPEDNGNVSTSWSKIPTTSFVSLNDDGTVTFTAYNFEPNTQWRVLMGEFGTRGVGGIFVQNLTSVDGTFNITSEIPPELLALDKIAIRFEQVDGPYYAFDWFSTK